MGVTSTEHPMVTQPMAGPGSECMQGREAVPAGGTVGTAVTAAAGALVGGDGGDTTLGGAADEGGRGDRWGTSSTFNRRS